MKVLTALALTADRLLVERPSSSGPPGSSFGSLIKKSTKAGHQKLHIFPFLAFLEPEEHSPGRQSRSEKKSSPMLDMSENPQDQPHSKMPRTILRLTDSPPYG